MMCKYIQQTGDNFFLLDSHMKKCLKYKILKEKIEEFIPKHEECPIIPYVQSINYEAVLRFWPNPWEIQPRLCSLKLNRTACSCNSSILDGLRSSRQILESLIFYHSFKSSLHYSE